jgi:hypothetical protein
LRGKYQASRGKIVTEITKILGDEERLSFRPHPEEQRNALRLEGSRAAEVAASCFETRPPGAPQHEAE